MINVEGSAVHTIKNAGVRNRPFLREPGKPLSFEQENVGSVASTSEMRVIAGSLKSSNIYEPTHVDLAGEFSQLSYTGSYSDFTPVFSARSSKTSSYDGTNNRSYAVVNDGWVYSYDNTILCALIRSPTLNGANWTGGLLAGSDTDFDFTASGSITDGNVFKSWIVKAGDDGHVNFTSIFEEHKNWITRNADINVDPDHLTFAVKPLPTGTESGSVAVTFNFEIYRR